MCTRPEGNMQGAFRETRANAGAATRGTASAKVRASRRPLAERIVCNMSFYEAKERFELRTRCGEVQEHAVHDCEGWRQMTRRRLRSNSARALQAPRRERSSRLFAGASSSFRVSSVVSLPCEIYKLRWLRINLWVSTRNVHILAPKSPLRASMIQIQRARKGRTRILEYPVVVRLHIHIFRIESNQKYI